MLEVEQINVYYGDLQALWDVTFNVKDKEIVSVIGPNGAGKTTILRAISGLIHPRTGRISFLGTDITKTSPHKIVNHGIVHVPEGRRLFPEMTVLENLEMGAYVKGAWDRRHETLEWVFNLFPTLRERKNQLTGTLSGGEQQMLAIARGLMSRPKILLLDEPSSGLAPKIMAKMFEAILKLNEEGVTILLVEQNVHSALEVSHRGYILENGKIVLSDSAEKLIKNSYVKRCYLGI
ncbi:MAG: ABC transporter ATP-binding protein [Candidatus Methanomethylicia archaeon]